MLNLQLFEVWKLKLFRRFDLLDFDSLGQMSRLWVSHHQVGGEISHVSHVISMHSSCLLCESRLVLVLREGAICRKIFREGAESLVMLLDLGDVPVRLGDLHHQSRMCR